VNRRSQFIAPNPNPQKQDQKTIRTRSPPETGMPHDYPLDFLFGEGILRPVQWQRQGATPESKLASEKPSARIAGDGMNGIATLVSGRGTLGT